MYLEPDVDCNPAKGTVGPTDSASWLCQAKSSFVDLSRNLAFMMIEHRMREPQVHASYLHSHAAKI